MDLKEKSTSLDRKGHTYIQWTLAILANMTIVTYGLQLGWVSPATKVLKSASSPTGAPLSETEITWIASIPSLVAMPAVIASLYMADACGRKICILIIGVLQGICWIIKLCPLTAHTLMIARISSGLAAGSCFHVVPMYVKEISQPEIAGTLGSFTILSQNIGITLMYALGGYLDFYTVLWIVTGLPIITFLLFLKAPESPDFLVKKGKIKEANQAIALLRGLDISDKKVENEIDAIIKSDSYYKSLPQLSFREIFKNRAWRRGFLVMLLVLVAHGSNGTFAITNHAASLLANSGINLSPQLQSLCVPVFQMIGSIVNCNIIDRLGRKVLLAASHVGIALALLCLATSQLVQHLGGSPPGWLPVVAMATALFGQGAGVAPVPYVVMLEIFKFQIRAKLIGVLILGIHFLLFIQLFSLELITTHLGVYTAFYWFTLINVYGVAVVVFVMPETRMKSVEQIERELAASKNVDEEKS